MLRCKRVRIKSSVSVACRSATASRSSESTALSGSLSKVLIDVARSSAREHAAGLASASSSKAQQHGSAVQRRRLRGDTVAVSMMMRSGGSRLHGRLALLHRSVAMREAIAVVRDDCYIWQIVSLHFGCFSKLVSVFLMYLKLAPGTEHRQGFFGN